MKKYFYLNGLMMAFVGMLLIQSCKDSATSYTKKKLYIPIQVSYEALVNSCKIEGPKSLVAPGKIYAYKKLLLIAESKKGIHVIDNTTPSNPVHLSFIAMLGNTDIAVQNDILFADNGNDYVSIDISNPAAPTFVGRTTNVFTERKLSDGNIIVGYEYRDTVIKSDYQGNLNSGGVFTTRQNMAFSLSSLPTGSAGNTTGTAGSLAGTTILNGYFYVLHDYEFDVFKINNTKLNFISKQQVNNKLETIFPFKNQYLMFGTTTGVLIYGVNNPTAPNYISIFQHARMCDPVVAQGNFAFTTMRAGSTCGTADRSNITALDISTITQPTEINSFDLTTPYGLGVDGKLLIVGEKENGMKLFNWDESSKKITLVKNYPDIKATDVIPLGGTLIVTADNGLFQYDYSDPGNLVLLGKIN